MAEDFEQLLVLLFAGIVNGCWGETTDVLLTRVVLLCRGVKRARGGATIKPVTTFLLVRSLLSSVQCGTWLKAERLVSKGILRMRCEGFSIKHLKAGDSSTVRKRNSVLVVTTQSIQLLLEDATDFSFAAFSLFGQSQLTPKSSWH